MANFVLYETIIRLDEFRRICKCNNGCNSRGINDEEFLLN